MDAFLREHATKDINSATHLSLTGGKYNIPYNEFTRFFELYLKYEGRLCLMERSRYPCKLFVDLDNVDNSVVSELQNKTREEHMIVCYRSESEDSNQRTGVHLIFTNRWVHSPEEAIQEARALFPDADTSVYRSGLRMILSCKNKFVDRVYKLKEETHTTQDLYNASILLPWSINLPMRLTKGTQDSGVSRFNIDLSRIHEKYKSINVTNVTKWKQCYVVKTLNHFCMNVQREHRSNHIYFIINSKKQITQKCYCTCADTKCSQYTSTPYPCPLVVFYRIKQFFE